MPLSDFIDRAGITVQVGGEDVHLRPPDFSIQASIREFLEASKDNQGEAFLRMSVAALSATVTGQDLTEEQWERFVSMPEEQNPDPEGSRALINAAFKLCNMDLDKEDDARTTDHAAEAAEDLGNS